MSTWLIQNKNPKKDLATYVNEKRKQTRNENKSEHYNK